MTKVIFSVEYTPERATTLLCRLRGFLQPRAKEKQPRVILYISRKDDFTTSLLASSLEDVIRLYNNKTDFALLTLALSGTRPQSKGGEGKDLETSFNDSTEVVRALSEVIATMPMRPLSRQERDMMARQMGLM